VLSKVRAQGFAAISAWLADELRGGQLGAVCVVHPEGDGDRPAEWEEHTHLNFGFPLISFLPNGERRAFHWYREDLDRLRLVFWRPVLEVLNGGPLGRDCNVKYLPERQRTREQTAKKIAHNLKYMPRGFPGWDAEAQPVSWHGALGCNVVNKNVPELATVRLEEESDVRTCPTCGGPVRVEVDMPGVGWSARGEVNPFVLHRRRCAAERGPAPPRGDTEAPAVRFAHVLEAPRRSFS
jgi:hypothetical protein